MADSTCFSHFDSPVGRITIEGNERAVSGLHMTPHRHWRGLDPCWQQSDATFTEVRRQLAEYFAGQRQEFNVPLDLVGTPFQRRVWQELVRIPFGATISYAELAQRIGQPTAVRAVGSANGRNPVSIIVPCHRVIGADGRLTGYGGGLDKKQWLLDWERRAEANGSDGSGDRVQWECDTRDPTEPKDRTLADVSVG